MTIYTLETEHVLLFTLVHALCAVSFIEISMAGIVKTRIRLLHRSRTTAKPHRSRARTILADMLDRTTDVDAPLLLNTADGNAMIQSWPLNTHVTRNLGIDV